MTNHRKDDTPRKFDLDLTDINEHKQAEQEILRSKTEWERTFDSVPDLIAILDDQHRIVRVNRAMAQRLGVTPEQCVGLKCHQCVHGTDAPPELCPHAQTLQDGKEHVAEMHEDRLGGDFLVSTTPLSDERGQMVGSVHVARDITEHRHIEQALKDSQSDLNRAQAVAKTGSWRLDTRNNLLLWSDETYRLFGIPKGIPLTYEAFIDAVHPNDRAYVDKKWKSALNGASYEIEHRIIVNGEIKWVREKAELDFDENNVLKGGFGTVQDITERKKAERELVDTLEASHNRQAEVSALLEASKAVLVHRDVRKAAQSIFGSCKELLGASAGYIALLSKDETENEVLFLDAGGFPCRVDPSLPMPIRGLRAKAYGTGKVVYCNDFPSSEWASLMPEGHVALKNVLFSPLKNENKTVGIIGLANKPIDFTERDAQMASAFGEMASIALINSQMLEKLEENEKLLKAHSEDLEKLVQEKTEQLKTAERLAAIGETAGMIGHDIRNPLQAIIGELYLSKDSLHSLPEDEAKHELADSMHVIEDQVVYINKIVTDLQDYARPLMPSIEDADFEEIATSVLSTVEVPENVEVTYFIEKNFPNLSVDCSYMKRILTNLTINAVQAMPDGGKLTINAYCRGNRAYVSVEDTGEGIPEKAKNKMFKPLFTTKAKGQGFGLAVVKKLTEALNGTITFESEEGKGTKFIIEFPKNSNVHRKSGNF
jgi:PAS domain S-box-containing protein